MDPILKSVAPDSDRVVADQSLSDDQEAQHPRELDPPEGLQRMLTVDSLRSAARTIRRHSPIPKDNRGAPRVLMSFVRAQTRGRLIDIRSDRHREDHRARRRHRAKVEFRNQKGEQQMLYYTDFTAKNMLSRLLLGALLAVCAAPLVSAADTDPIMGTWKLNLARSVFAGIPALKSQVRTYSGSARKFTLKMTTVSAEGKETVTQARYELDGEYYPSMGNLDFDSLAGVQIDTNTAEFTLKRAGKQVGKIRRAVSNDGRTLTINYVLTNAEGIQTSALTVFDKQ